MEKRQTETPPRILMALSYFHPYRGGAENQALLLAGALRKRGLDVCVMTRSFRHLPSFERIHGVPVHRCIKTISAGKLFSLLYAASSFLFMLRHRRRYDVIHCHILQGFHSPAAVIAGFLLKKKTVIKLTSSGPTSDFVSLAGVCLGGTILKLLRRTDRLVATSAVSAREARQHGFSPGQIVLIPNGVDTRRFRPREQYADARDRIVCAGRLIAGKGIDTLIEAFAQLRSDLPGLRLDIVGDGPQRGSLVEKAAEAGCRDAVSFHGEVQDVERFFDNRCVFVQPSLSEGMSNVILEAMACGLPVVATRAGASPDIVRDGANGVLVDAGSIVQIRGALHRVISDEDFARRLGTKARKTIEENYAIDIVAERYSELYHDLLKSQREAVCR